MPFNAMKISRNQFLPGWLLGHILNTELEIKVKKKGWRKLRKISECVPMLN